MALPSNIVKQIEEDASCYGKQRHDSIGLKKHLRIKTIARYGYMAGATEYAAKVQKMADALLDLYNAYSDEWTGHYKEKVEGLLSEWNNTKTKKDNEK